MDVDIFQGHRCGNHREHNCENERGLQMWKLLGAWKCRWVGAQIWQLLSGGAGHGCSIYLRALSHTRGTEVEINGAWM